MVESGFQSLDGSEDENAKYAEGNTEGWDHELAELLEYASQHVQESARR